MRFFGDTKTAAGHCVRIGCVRGWLCSCAITTAVNTITEITKTGFSAFTAASVLGLVLITAFFFIESAKKLPDLGPRRG